jgi:glutaconyl-CoA/methylmalonyl-CoA decarboxylase subunit gamma
MRSGGPELLTNGRSTTNGRGRAPRRGSGGLLPSRAVGRAQRYQVTVEGQQHEVSVELDAAGQPTRARVDDVWCSVRLGADDALLVRAEGEEGPQHTVYLSPGRRPSHAVAGGDVLAVEVKSAQQAALEAALASASGGGGSGTIKAPMPGRVVRVLVAEGDAVQADVPLLIVEAMKMENEVRATAAGVVRRLSVAAGDTVEAGQLLCEVAAPA